MPLIPGVCVVSTAPLTGVLSVTLGGVVSTVQVTAALVPVFAAGVALSLCVACAVYVPSPSAEASNVHVPPPLTFGVTVWSSAPPVVAPA